MPATTLIDPFLNPLKFHPLDNVQPAQYLSRFQDDWAFRRTIQPWDEKVCFYQPFLQSDQVRLQYTSDFGGMLLKLYDENGYLQATAAFNTMQQNELQPTFFIRQIAFNLAAYPPGKYFFTRSAPGQQVYYSEPIEILEEPESGIFLDDDNPTLCLEYSHWEPYGGIKFFAPYEGLIRIPGILKYKEPGSVDNVYPDQALDMTMINSVPFRVWQLIAGGRYGVPPWFIDKVARIAGCSNFKIDGRLFTKDEGAKFEPGLAEFYPMASWSIDLREKLNRDSQTIEDDVIVEGIQAAAVLVDSKGFGIDGGGSDYNEIITLQ